LQKIQTKYSIIFVIWKGFPVTTFSDAKIKASKMSFREPHQEVAQAARQKPETTRRDDVQGVSSQVGAHENPCLAAIANLFEERLGEC
jgi:hypothetical protein